MADTDPAYLATQPLDTREIAAGLTARADAEAPKDHPSHD